MLWILGLMKPLPENLRGDMTIIEIICPTSVTYSDFLCFQKFRLLHLVNYNTFDTKECYTKPKAVKRWKKKEEKNYDVESL